MGQLVNSKGTVYLVGDKGLIGIPNLDVFNSWCFSFKEVVPANTAEDALSVVRTLETRAQGQLLPTGVSALKVTTCQSEGADVAVKSLIAKVKQLYPALEKWDKRRPLPTLFTVQAGLVLRTANTVLDNIPKNNTKLACVNLVKLDVLLRRYSTSLYC